MYRTGSILLRFLGVLILAGALITGGVLIYQAGQAQGYQAGIAAGAAASGETPGVTPVIPYGPSYWPYYAQPPFGFFPFGWLCGSIFFVLLALFALRLIIWPQRWSYSRKGSGEWGDHPHAWGPHPWGPHPWMQNQPQPETGKPGAKSSVDQPAGESPA